MWQIQYIWILGVQEFVLFVLDDVLCLLSKFNLRLRVYSVLLDPQCAGVGGADNESGAKGKSS
jgi:hypothetical protein